jgi:replicative DNA helicase
VSVEALVVAALVEEGSPKRAFMAGITTEDFELHDEEFDWIVFRAEKRKPINTRLFKKQFPEFDFIRSREKLADLLDELKQERAYVAVSSGIDEVLLDLSADNAIEKASLLREVMGNVLKLHSPNSDVLVKTEFQSHLDWMKKLSILHDNGVVAGIPTGLAHLDHHWGGLQGQASYLVLGRPGDAKSFTLAKFATSGAWAGYRVGFFSPEMTEHQHLCRFYTLFSAIPEIQQACGLRGAFRNRALREGHGFNMKTYKRFLEYVNEEMKGEIILLTQKYRREKMSTAYIESRVEDLGLEAVIVDPLYKLRPPRRRGNRWEELAEITDSLVDLAHAFNIPVVLSNQANRALMGRGGEPPGKDSSFGSDSPVQEANTEIGVRHYSDERIMKFNCSKNRDGEPFRFTAKFVPNVGELYDVTRIKGDYFNNYDPEKVDELSSEIRGELNNLTN